MAKRLCFTRAILYGAHAISTHKKYQPIQSKLNWNWWLKKDRWKRSFLLNFIRTQMNQLVSVKQIRSSLYVREHLALTFSSNASRRSLAIYDSWYLFCIFYQNCFHVHMIFIIIVVGFSFSFVDRWLLSHFTVTDFSTPNRLMIEQVRDHYSWSQMSLSAKMNKEKIIIRFDSKIEWWNQEKKQQQQRLQQIAK